MDQPIRYITPAVTPLLPDGGIDFPSCETLYRYLIDKGMDGILILGSIGEFFGFTPEQKKELIRCARKAIGSDTQLIVGTTSMVFDEMVDLSNFAIDQGADGVMLIPPYYFWFNDAGVFRYYDELAQAIHGNIYIYNFPERTGYSIAPQVLRDLAQKHPNIVGLKDTVPGVDHTREVIKAVRPVRPDFIVYSGFDDNLAHNVMCGGNGCISGMSNLFPELAAAWAQALREKDFARSQKFQQLTDSLMDIYSVGSPFIPAMKEGLVQKGILRHAAVTKPMTFLTAGEKERLKEIMARCVVD
ncbi:MAG: dihydrodipicolinate synthase family protein [Oscillospiraceae bacterium]|jgi:dihydrodipicolinate synthase/N-acetylneuraminate lyase|nr:dihydrodipicolinate synthase family protein [Oscillospiraceae bacterium]